MAVAVIWHYWIGVVIAVGTVLTILAVLGAFLRKTQSPRYPRSR